MSEFPKSVNPDLCAVIFLLVVFLFIFVQHRKTHLGDTKAKMGAGQLSHFNR